MPEHSDTFLRRYDELIGFERKSNLSIIRVTNKQEIDNTTIIILFENRYSNRYFYFSNNYKLINYN